MSRLYNITAMWMFITMACRAIDTTLSHYQVQVSEFAKELLVAQEHYKHDPNFWVNSSLVEHQEIEEAVFKAAHVASSNFDGLSASEAT